MFTLEMTGRHHAQYYFLYHAILLGKLRRIGHSVQKSAKQNNF